MYLDRSNVNVQSALLVLIAVLTLTIVHLLLVLEEAAVQTELIRLIVPAPKNDMVIYANVCDVLFHEFQKSLFVCMSFPVSETSLYTFA